MLYELPYEPAAPAATSWPRGADGIPVRLAEGGMAELPVLPGVSCLTLGVTGTGKTASFTLPAAERLLAAQPRMRGVFFETKRTFLDRFLRPGDKVIAHSGASGVPEESLFRWCLIREVRQARDPEAEMMQIADALFSDLLSGADNNLSWVESARNTFLAVLRVIVDGSREDTGNRRLISALRGMPVERLLAYISRHPRNHSLLSKDFGYPIHDPDSYRPTRRAGDILFFLNQVLERFSGNFASDGTDTIHDYLHGAYGRDLFLLHDLAAAERSRPFLLYFLSKLKDEKMSLSSDVRDPMLWCLDEADKLADGGRAADFGLFQAATLGREYGLQVLLTTQSLESLFGLAPDFNEHIARSGLAGFPMLLAFRPGDPATVEALQTLFGSTRREIVSLPLSRYDQPAVRSEREALVTDGDFASLGVGECYGKLAACPPVRLCFLPPR